MPDEVNPPPADAPAESPVKSNRQSAANKRSAATPARRVPGIVPMLFLFVGLIFGPALVRGVPREIGRWHAAAALENRADGEKDRAYQNMQKAIEWDVDQPGYYLQRAEWRNEDGDHAAALGDSTRAREIAVEPGDRTRSLIVQATTLQYLGRHGEAISNWKQIERISFTSGIPERTTALNALAYARALGNQELDEGLRDVEEALRLLPKELPAADAKKLAGYRILKALSDGERAGVLDTRGYLRYQRGEYDQALKDLDEAVKISEQCLQVIKTESVADFKRLNPSADRDEQLKSIKRSTAVLRYHRSLIYDKLGLTEPAKQDRARVKELIGREGDEKLF